MKRKFTVLTGLIFIVLLTFYTKSYAANLTINFTGMTPHNGQELYLRIFDETDGSETTRTHVTASTDFSLDFTTLTAGHSYQIDFFADVNGNGLYDDPPTDHAWRLNLDNALEDNTLDFAHNTNFTDIMWPYLFTLDFTGMTPHVGQLLQLRLVNKADDSEVGRVIVPSVPGPDFSLKVLGIVPGNSYRVDFFADLNGNKIYDPPSADHAWRMDLDNVTGDATLSFAHNTNFTDIMWPYLLTMNFTGMTPHVGQLLELRVVNKDDATEVGRVKLASIPGPDFSLTVPGIEPGNSYMVDFFADLNGNKVYDPPSADHAWRMDLDDVYGDTSLTFSHNTNFTDIMWPYLLTMNFTGMTPHVGQLLELRVVNKDDAKEVGRVKLASIPGTRFFTYGSRHRTRK